MADIVSPEVRSRMMSGIRGRDTKPEMTLRKGLHALGLRFRLNAGDLPGRPDIVFPRYRAVIFANGCFWHGHDCALFKLPATRREFWQAKISANQTRDARALQALRSAGWRVAIVWECALRGKERVAPESICRTLANWIREGEDDLVLP